LAAKAAFAANKQDKYVAFHRALYEPRGRLMESKIFDVAEAVGLDVDRLKVDMPAPRSVLVSARITAHRKSRLPRLKSGRCVTAECRIVK
jgi:protein-disulfide isomerase